MLENNPQHDEHFACFRKIGWPFVENIIGGIGYLANSFVCDLFVFGCLQRIVQMDENPVFLSPRFSLSACYIAARQTAALLIERLLR